ncbi:MAG: hypothetical protein HOV80_15625 [Polyangiaceae bacterium]|nr:hypothetical protein [Polyangiaceae bacterium]
MKPRQPLHPDDEAFLKELAARPSALTPEEDLRLDRLMAFADVVVPRLTSVVEDALPSLVVGMLGSTLRTCLSTYPLIEPMFDAATAAWPAPDNEIAQGPPFPERAYEDAMYRAGDSSLFDFLLAVSKPPPTGDVRSLERILFGAVAAFLIGALVAIDRMPPQERAAAQAASKKGRALLDAHLAELDTAARERLATVSLHIDRRERDPKMETLDLDDRKAHAESMLRLGDWLARGVRSPFAVPPAL